MNILESNILEVTPMGFGIYVCVFIIVCLCFIKMSADEARDEVEKSAKEIEND